MLYFSRISSFSFDHIKQEISHSVSEQDKRIALIALLIFGLALGYLFYRCCCFKAKASSAPSDDKRNVGIGVASPKMIHRTQEEQIADLLKEGKEALEKRASAEASDKFKQVLDLDPQNITALKGCGKALLLQRKFQEAEDYLRQAKSQAPKEIELQILLGKCLLRQGKASDAATCYEEALKLGPNNGDVLLGYAKVLYEQNRLNEALGKIKTLLTASTAESHLQQNAHLVEGHIFFAQGNLNAAHKSYAASLGGGFNLRTDNLVKLLRRGSGHAAFAFQIFQSIIDTHNLYHRYVSFLREGVQQLRVLGLLTEATALENLINNATNASHLLAKVNALRNRNDLKKADAVLKKAYVLNPKDINVLCMYGKRCFAYDRHKAGEIFQEALRVDPNNVVALTYHARILNDTGDVNRALETIEKALSLAPDDIDAFIVHVDILCKLEKFQEALTAVEKVLKLHPQHPVAPSYLIKIQEALAAVNK